MDALKEQAARIRASGALGRSQPMRRLFDFLVDCSERGIVPREYDIALEVFQRSETFDVSQDASVRVYVHRLRQKLDDYYEMEGNRGTRRLVIPKGEYRLTLENRPATDDADMAHGGAPPPRPRFFARARYVLAAALLGLLLLNGGIWLTLWPQPAAPDRLAQLRHMPLWAPIVEDRRTVILAVGDYYIFGDLGDNMNVERLIREFSVNSREGLYEYLLNHPDKGSEYVDMGLRYLPTSTAHALTRVLPLLTHSAATADRVRVVLSSDLTPGMMKTAHIVYIGFLSALGPLREPAFAGSRFLIGDTYDEIVDEETGRTYISAVNRMDIPGISNVDYGLVSSFAGPTGNRIVVIAGTRDVAIRQVSEELTNPAALSTLTEKAGGGDAFEALYAVEAIEQYNMGAKLVAAGPLDSAEIWNSTQSLTFPTE